MVINVPPKITAIKKLKKTKNKITYFLRIIRQVDHRVDSLVQ